jgi:hypothetical protein
MNVVFQEQKLDEEERFAGDIMKTRGLLQRAVDHRNNIFKNIYSFVYLILQERIIFF